LVLGTIDQSHFSNFLRSVSIRFQCHSFDTEKSTERSEPVKSKGKSGPAWHIYRLSDLGDDPNLCQWLADVIAEAIPKDPGTQVKYYAPSRILVIYHTGSVTAQVQAFLDDLKETLPQEKGRGIGHVARSLQKTQAVVPAKFPSSLAKTIATVSDSGSPTEQPRHLFQIMIEGLDAKGEKVKLKSFTIRYEGEGIIDSNLAWLIKSLNQQSTDKDQETGKGSLNTADLTRYLKEILGVASSVTNGESLQEPESTAKAGNAAKLPDSQPAEESTAGSVDGPKPDVRNQVEASSFYSTEWIQGKSRGGRSWAGV
jgi:hypothetical protein